MESIFMAIGFGVGYIFAWLLVDKEQEEMKKQWEEYELTHTEEE